MIKLSKPSKMPCLSWSLQAIDTCPGSKGKNGELVDACKGCYATDGNYRFPNVVAVREHNRDDWKRDDWTTEMINALEKQTYFRWFDSGDVYSLSLARKILDVMLNTPHVKHWLPTRMHKFAKFRLVLSQMERLPNVVVRRSSDSISGKTVRGKTTSTIIPTSDNSDPKLTVCRAYERQGKCGDCRACWNKDIKTIAYPAHGRPMTKLIKLQEVA